MSKRKKKSYVNAATGDVYYQLKVREHEKKVTEAQNAKIKKKLNEEKKQIAAEEKKINEELKKQRKIFQIESNSKKLALANKRKELETKLGTIPNKKMKIKKEM